jgi:hypothetical protein
MEKYRGKRRKQMRIDGEIKRREESKGEGGKRE